MRVLLVLLSIFTLNSCVDTKLNNYLTPTAKIVKNSSKEMTMLETNYNSLSTEQKKLLDEARDVMKQSYAPYSHFHVGSAVRTFSDEIISGTNVENAAYGPTICAERTALFRANALGNYKVKSIAIIGKGDDFNTEDVVAPCGVCRQVIYEFAQRADYDIEVIMSNSLSDKVVVAHISDLLPLAFGPKDLGIKPQ